jgi:hypothetical protein
MVPYLVLSWLAGAVEAPRRSRAMGAR